MRSRSKLEKGFLVVNYHNFTAPVILNLLNIGYIGRGGEG